MDDPLAAIPLIAAGVEARMDSRGRMHVRKAQLYSGGWPQRLAYRLGWRADLHVQLDEYGTFYWQQINGENSLGEIAARFAARFGHSLADSRRAVVQFTRDLLDRRLIQLHHPAATGTEDKA
ncbi:MAG: PqqD family protein [Verrucomicrobiae bacterium]|nr:PqqD family protein [Verrucomicrobiae bacterium]